MTTGPATFRRREIDGAACYVITLDPREGEILATIAGDSRNLIETNPEFAALLVPNAYPDDAEASEEFDHYTADDLGAARVAELALLAAAPSAGGDFVLSAEEAPDALKGLAFLRLMLSDETAIDPDAEDSDGRGIAGSGSRDATDAAEASDSDGFANPVDESREIRAAVSSWLGWVQESLIEALDDESPSEN